MTWSYYNRIYLNKTTLFIHPYGENLLAVEKLYSSDWEWVTEILIAKRVFIIF